MFDTNVVVSALIVGRKLAWLRRVWAERIVVPVVCRETASELLKVLGYPKFQLTRHDRDLLLGDYLPFAEVAVLPRIRPALLRSSRDPDDAVFIELAVSATVDFLVTGDRDLTSIRDPLPVRILAPEELRELLE